MQAGRYQVDIMSLQMSVTLEAASFTQEYSRNDLQGFIRAFIMSLKDRFLLTIAGLTFASLLSLMASAFGTRAPSRCVISCMQNARSVQHSSPWYFNIWKAIWWRWSACSTIEKLDATTFWPLSLANMAPTYDPPGYLYLTRENAIKLSTQLYSCARIKSASCLQCLSWISCMEYAKLKIWSSSEKTSLYWYWLTTTNKIKICSAIKSSKGSR